MAIVWNGAGNTTLGTASGFYRVETYNWSLHHSTILALTTTRYAYVQFANACNCLGGVFSITPNTGASANVDRSVIITLDENSGYPATNSWSTVASKTLTTAELTNSTFHVGGRGDAGGCDWVNEFLFTSGYAVDNSAPVAGIYKYRFSIAQTGGTVGTWSSRTSDGTNIFYAGLGDNAVSFSDNDALLVSGSYTVTQDAIATVRGVLGTGDTTNATAIILCKSSDPTIPNMARLIMGNYAFTCDGICYCSAQTGVKGGTAAARLTSGSWTFSTPTYGTQNGFRSRMKSSLLFYGSIPTYENSILTYDALADTTVTMSIADPCVVTKSAHGYSDGSPCSFTTTGALPTGLVVGTVYWTRSTGANTFNLYDTYAHAIAGGATGRVATSGTQSGTHTLKGVIYVDDAVDWVNGDLVYLDKHSGGGLPTLRTYTVSSVSGNQVLLTTALLDKYKATAPTYQPNDESFYRCKVIRKNGYGYTITGIATNYGNFSYPSNLVFSGVRFITFLMAMSGGSGAGDSSDDTTNLALGTASHCHVETAGTFLAFSAVPIKGFTSEYVSFYETSGFAYAAIASGTFTMQYCNFYGTSNRSFAVLQLLALYDLHHNRFMHEDTFSGSSAMALSFYNNYCWGGRNHSEWGTHPFATMVAPLKWEKNIMDGYSSRIFASSILQLSTSYDSYWDEIASSAYTINCAMNLQYNILNKVLIYNPMSGLNIYRSNLMMDGSWVRIVNYDDTLDDCRSWYRQGYFISSSGTIISKITRASSPLVARYYFSTKEVISSKLYFSVQVTIASATYYSETYVLPTLTLNYDSDSSEDAVATASTSLQSISGVVSPTEDNKRISIDFSSQSHYAATMTVAAPCVVTAGGAFPDLSMVSFYTTGAMPTGISVGEPYYVRRIDDTTFNISSSPTGGLITTTGTQYGTHTIANDGSSAVTWKDLVLNLRRYGYEFQDQVFSFIQTSDDIQGILDNSTLNSLITETTAATVEAYTGITINHSTQVCTISVAHTWAELYDYSQWDLCEDANMDTSAWLTSTDGITYESVYDIIVDGVNLNATGKIIDCGSNDFQLVAGGTVTATRVTDVDGTSVSVFLDGVINGSSYDVFDAVGNSVGSGTATGDVTINYTHTGDLAVTAVVRLFGYLEWTGSGTITVNGLTLNVAQVADLNTASYPAGVATDFTIVDDTSIAHTSGTTVYTTRQLYNYTMDYFADSAKCQVALPISAQTPFDFTLISPYTMSDATHEYIKSGSITEAGGDTLWSAVYTVGTIASGNIYVYQNGAEYTKYWGTGNVDILLKVKTAGTLIDSGNVTLLCREYSYTYDHYEVDLSGGGRVAVSLTTAADANNATLEATIAGWTDITITTGGGPYSHDIGDGEGSQPYTTEIDAGGHAIQDVYERLKYVAEEGQSGEYYLSANAAYAEVKAAPYGTFAGGIFFGARGIWVDNVASADALNYVLIDNNNITHQAPSPPVNIEISGIVNGSRVQIYDTDTSTELLNEISTGTSSITATAGHAYRYRIIYVNGVNAYEWLAGTGTVGASGSSFTVAQTVNATYETNNIDGSTVTECSISGATIRIYIDDPDNTTSAQRIYNWYQYYLFTEAGIAEQDGDSVVATDTTHYTFISGTSGSPAVDISMKIINQDTANPLNITGANIVPTSGAATDIFDLTNGASIALNFNRVEGFAYSSGSGLSTEEHDAVLGTKTAIDTNQPDFDLSNLLIKDKLS